MVNFVSLSIALLFLGMASRPAQAKEEALRLDTEQVLPIKRSSGNAGHSEQIVHQRFLLHNIPVREAFATLRQKHGSAPQTLIKAIPLHKPQLKPDQVHIDASQAWNIAANHANRRELASMTPAKNSEIGKLVYYPVLDTPILAWEINLPFTLGDANGTPPSHKIVWISAASGIVLGEWEQVQSSKALVFPINPAHTPDPVEVELSGIQVENSSIPLDGTRIRSFNCTLTPPNDVNLIPAWREEDECYPLQRTMSDANGDYFVPLPDVRFPEDHMDGDDLYAELSMYFHAEKFLDTMALFGVEKFRCDLSTMLANFRYVDPPETDPDLPFGPLNNAYWTNVCDGEKGPTMVFGQGTAVDFGFDGDVVYHELGHGMVSLLTPSGLYRYKTRPDASVADGGAINESIADYFSIILTDDPELGDYVGRYSYGLAEGYIRTAETDRTCPENMIGQVHNDSEPLTAALWATRERVGKKLDKTIFDLLPRLPPDSDLELASHTLLTIAKEYEAQGEWSSQDVEHLIRAFDARGLFDCPRVIVDPELVSVGRSMWLRAKTSGVTPFYPGPLQLRHQVPTDSDNLIVRFRKTPLEEPIDVENPSGTKVLIKFADEPIAYTYTLAALDKEGDPQVEKISIRETTVVEGDWHEEHVPAQINEVEHQVIVRGLQPGDVAHIALVNLEGSEAIASSVSVVSVPPEFLDQGTSPQAEEESPAPEFKEGCGCHAASLGLNLGQGGSLLLLSMLLLPFIRRSRKNA